MLPIIAQHFNEARAHKVAVWTLNSRTTIETLIARNGPDGTHSILDMNRVVDRAPQPTTLREWLAENQKTGKLPDPNDLSGTFFPRIGSISPLSEHQLIILFGTTEPSRQMVERAAADRRLDELRDCGEGFYVVVYGDGAPNEIYFAGCSGD